MEILKAKITKDNTLVATYKDENGTTTVEGKNLVTNDLKRAFSMLVPHMAFLCEQKEAENTALLAAYEYSGKPQLLLMYSPDLVAAGRNASRDIKNAAKAILGGGGGQPGLATAGGKNPDGLSAAVDKILELAGLK